MIYKDLLRKHPIITDQVDARELEIILYELEKVLDEKKDGEIVELGCYAGTTSLFIQRLLKVKGTKKFHVYDSFEGLPDKTHLDESPLGKQFKPGELFSSKSDLIKNFKKAGLPLPVIHKGWFNELSQKDMPSKIAFAFLDGDFYESIKHSLKLIEPSLQPGSVVIIDDYMNESLPGAKKATDEWTAGRNVKVRLEASLAVIHI